MALTPRALRRLHRFQPGWLVLAATLGACGGQTGGAEESQSPTEIPTAVNTVPAVPKAPALGDLLWQDASTLRPLADEALWVYRGTHRANGQVLHLGSFRQTLDRSGVMEERRWSPLDTVASTVTLQVAGGTLTQAWTAGALGLPAAAGRLQPWTLRSPVRANEQTALIERQDVPLDEDRDADGKPDHLDVAAWTRVIGFEEVDLPELQRSVRALRVDLTVVTRTQLSSRPQPEASLTVRESTWAAPGIGIVRVSRTAPSAIGVGPEQTDERLQFWDGISQGLGLQPSVPLSVTGAADSVGPWLAPALSAVRLGTQVFVLSALDGSPSRGVVLSVLNNRGRVERSVQHPGLVLTSNTQAQLLSLGSGVGVVRREPGVLLAAQQLENLKMLRFDTLGQRMGKDVWLADGALPGSLQAASDGDTVWVCWVDEGLLPGSRRLMLRGYDTQGRPRTAAQALDQRAAGVSLERAHLTAEAGRVLVSWHVRSALADEWRQALGSTQAPAHVATLSSQLPFGAIATGPLPLLGGKLAALVWHNPLDSAASPVSTWRAVALDAQGQARRAAGRSLDQEVLPLPAGAAQAPERTALTVDTQRLLWATAGSARLREDSEAEDRLLAFAIVEPGDSTLSAAAVSVRRLRDRSPAATWSGTLQALQHIVPLDDRWLLFGHDGRYATVAVLHKR